MTDAVKVEIATPIPKKPSEGCVRLMSFNINGYKTLKDYHPWNELKNLKNMFDFLYADIITFQELKLQRDDIKLEIAEIPNFKSFITIPQTKKGYSGVGVFVRDSLNVVKVEEGITGWLDCRGKLMCYRKLDQIGTFKGCIGGYQDGIDRKIGLEIDSQGRCIIVELDNGLVVVSVYCPANSGLTEEGEEFRCLFLQSLMTRIENLKSMGKKVILMGDINVSPGLLDKDEYIREGIEAGMLRKCPEGEDMELVNKEQAIFYRKESSPSRKIINRYVYDTRGFTSNEDKSLWDLGREFHPKRIKMYTCWNTLKNFRPLNMGSRIDLFLSTFKEEVLACDILRYLYGSDHCPIYCDVDMSHWVSEPPESVTFAKHFEAKLFYGLVNTRKIDSFFKSVKKTPTPVATPASTPVSSQEGSRKRPLSSGYTSRKLPKGQSSISTFFTGGMKETEQIEEPEVGGSLFVAFSDEEEEEPVKEEVMAEPPKSTVSASQFNALLQSKSPTPKCKHGDQCVLRTVSQGENAGHRFWCCAKPRGDSWEKELDSQLTSCGFFKWFTK